MLADNDRCIVKYLGGAKYSAELLETSDSAEHLEKSQQRMTKEFLLTNSKPSSSLPSPSLLLPSLSLPPSSLPSSSLPSSSLPSSSLPSSSLPSSSLPSSSQKMSSIKLKNIKMPITNLSPVLLPSNNNGKNCNSGNFTSSSPVSTDVNQKSDHEIPDISLFIGPNLESNSISSIEVNNITANLDDTSPPPRGFSEDLNDLGPEWLYQSNLNDTSFVETPLAQTFDNHNRNSFPMIEMNNGGNPNLTYSLESEEISISFDIENVPDENNESGNDENSNTDNLTNTACNTTVQNNDSLYNPESTANTFNLSCENKMEWRPLLILKPGEIDQTKLKVSQSGTRSEKSKLYFCIYCKQLKTKFAAHLITRHKNESEVRDFMYLTKKSKRRAELIADIRNKGTFLHNTNPKFNKGQLIVARRLHKNSTNTAEDFLPCRICGNSYSKLSIRFHVNKCDPTEKMDRRKSRDVLKTCRSLTGSIHPVACKLLKETIFPVLRVQDDEVKCIKYDELIIKYGNKLCDNYTLSRQHDMIRAKLRLLGKFKLEMLKLENDMTIQMCDFFAPRLFDRVTEGLKIVSHWDPVLGSYKTPATAQSLSALIKACAIMAKSEFIKAEDELKERQADRFLHLWKEAVPVMINKKALEDQNNLKRDKKISLPSQADIKKLNDYLKHECEICLKKLNDKDEMFDFGTWNHLQECTLICIQLFNRRRAGEIERLTIDNYKNIKGFADDIDKKLLAKFSKNTLGYAKQFMWIVLRGKLGRSVSLLLSPIMIACIEWLRHHREAAGVIPENIYIFCKPGVNHLGKEYIRACPLMEKFSVDCGASMPKTLRGTNLRKHVATYVSLLNIEECQVDRLANFLGHNKDIHKNIYRIPVPVSEITEVSKLLTLAIGDKVNEEDDEMSEEEEDEEEDEEIQSAKRIVQERKEKGAKTVESSKEDHTKNLLNSELAVNNDGKDDNDRDDVDDVPNKSKRSNLKKRTTSAKEKVKRVRWTVEEKNAVWRYFGDLNKLEKLPTLEDCQKLINISSTLNSRTAEKIKAWIVNQRGIKNLK